MRRLAVCLTALALVTLAGCKKSNDDAKKAEPKAATPAPATKPAEPPAAATPPAEVPAAPAANAVLKPDEVWTAVAGAASLGGMAKMEFMNRPMAVTGSVAKVNDDPVGEYGVELDAGGGNVVELRFGDFGKAAKDKKLAVGAAVSAKECVPTNPAGTKLALVQCKLD